MCSVWHVRARLQLSTRAAQRRLDIRSGAARGLEVPERIVAAGARVAHAALGRSRRRLQVRHVRRQLARLHALAVRGTPLRRQRKRLQGGPLRA